MSQRPPTKPHVEISGAGFHVHPGVVRLTQESGFSIVNDTDESVWVALPGNLLSKDDVGRQQREKRLKDVLPTDIANLFSRAQFVAPGAEAHFDIADFDQGTYEHDTPYDYHVVVFKGGTAEPAPGNSPPKIIIEA